MKTIPVEQLGDRLASALEQQDEHEAIRLTKNASTVAWVLQIPKAMKDVEPDSVFIDQGPDDRVLFIVQAKHVVRPAPVFGAGRGTLDIVDEDDEHLKDFQEYME